MNVSKQCVKDFYSGLKDGLTEKQRESLRKAIEYYFGVEVH